MFLPSLRPSAAKLLRSASCLALLAFLAAGCSSSPVSTKDRITTPGTTAQKKNETRSPYPGQPGTPVGAAPALTVHQAPPVAPRATPVKVALLAPLSGKSAALGQAMVNAAQLAVFDNNVPGFELMPRDTGGTPEGAVSASRDAVASGAQLIIGPLFAAEVAAVKPDLHAHGLNMLALSTDVSLAEPGLYVMGFAPTPQVERVVAFAAGQGAKRFAALIPHGPYGHLVEQAFKEAVQQNGGELIAVDSVDKIPALAEKKEQIDALLLPFGGAELRRIAGQLSAAGFEKERTKLMGTGLWDEPRLAEGQPFLIGGFYAAAEPEARLRFIEKYKESYGQEPPRLATLAYDATALASALSRGGNGLDRALLTSPSGFAGLDGLFRLMPSGQIERGLAVSEITDTGSRIVEPAPTAFTAR